MRRRAAVAVVVMLASLFVGAPSDAGSEAECMTRCAAPGSPSEVAASTQAAEDEDDSNTAGVVVAVVLIAGWVVAGGLMIARARRRRETVPGIELNEPDP